MNFRAMRVISMAIITILPEIPWAPYGPQRLNTPVIQNEEDCRKLDLLLDMMGTLTRMMDTRINYVTTEGKVVREWIDLILELGSRYQRELTILESLENEISLLETSQEM